MNQSITDTQPDVSVVLTNWNVKDLTRDCIHSVKEKSEGFTHELIVVDDASTDGSVEMLRKEFPEATLLINDQNLGFAKANNRGVAVARGRYVLLLNTDTLLLNNAIKILLDFLETHPEAAACCGTLRNRDMTPQVSYGSFPSFTEALVGALVPKRIVQKTRLPDRGVVPDAKTAKPIETDYLSGADILIRKDVIERIGLFDERFTTYCEETDFCYRVRHQTDMKLCFVPSAEILHFGGMSYDNVKEYRLQLVYSSHDKYLKKHHGQIYSAATRGLYALQYVIRAAARWPAYLIKGGEERKRYLEHAGWHIKYSLFPQERKRT